MITLTELQKYTNDFRLAHILEEELMRATYNLKDMRQSPYMVSGCTHLSYPLRIGTAVNVRANKNSYDLYPNLKKRICESGTAIAGQPRNIGEKVRIPEELNPHHCPHPYLGNCAEQNAVKDWTNAHRMKWRRFELQDNEFEHLFFSYAIEYKTGVFRNPCHLCKTIFPQILVNPNLK